MGVLGTEPGWESSVTIVDLCVVEIKSIAYDGYMQ
jgi:hypothetical protein